MAEYQLGAIDSNVIRTEDGAVIPNDPSNRDFIKYQAWLDEGGIPDPYVPPAPPPPAPPSAEQEILFAHENRLRTLEGEPPLTLEMFIDKMVRR